MLAHLSTTPGLEQIFVTTYEEVLARRLAEFQPGRVRVEYLRARVRQLRLRIVEPDQLRDCLGF